MERVSDFFVRNPKAEIGYDGGERVASCLGRETIEDRDKHALANTVSDKFKFIIMGLNK